jgi:hypothetical protein
MPAASAIAKLRLLARRDAHVQPLREPRGSITVTI